MINIKEIIERLDIKEHLGALDKEIQTVISINDIKNATKSTILWINKKNTTQEIINQIKAGTLIVDRSIKQLKTVPDVTYLVSDNPRFSFLSLLKNFFIPEKEPIISSSAKISKDVVMGVNISIGENVVIEAACQLGDNVHIGHNTILYRNTIVGNNVTIGGNNTIGNIGFGYEKSKQGDYIQIPHIGNVVIEDQAEIGNNTCIDRAVIGSTIIGNNCKIDNLVHIAHGVKLGRNSVVIANAMVAGSVNIGENVWVAPSSSVLNKINIENDSVIGLGAVVIKNVEAHSIIIGNPGKLLKKTN